MLSIEDTEAMIATLRAQSRQLEASADALEAAIKPLKIAQESMASWTETSRAFFEFWQGKGLANSAIKPPGIDIKA
jgi:hypothetical protein